MIGPSHKSNASVEQWFFKERKELLVNLRNANSLEKELEERQKYVSFTERLCTRLGLHSIATCTTLLLLHRVLLRWPPTTLPPTYDLAATMLFLSLKVEEMPRALFHVLQHALSERFSSVENLQVKEQDAQVLEMRQRVVELERKCLVLLCFDMVVDNPYRHVQRFFIQMGQQPQQPQASTGMKQWKEAAVKRMLRSYYSLVHLEVSSRHVAGACIHATRPPNMEMSADLLLRLFKLDTTEPLERVNEIIDEDLKFITNKTDG